MCARYSIIASIFARRSEYVSKETESRESKRKMEGRRGRTEKRGGRGKELVGHEKKQSSFPQPKK